jgi:methylthioribose-1-phosphate isomerase
MSGLMRHALDSGRKAYSLGLGKQVPYTPYPDNTGGHLMQNGMVICFTDATATRKGVIANKIVTNLKALSAFDNDIPFYSLLPSTSIDFSLYDGMKEIIIEEREQDEVTSVSGYAGGEIKSVRICPDDAKAGNWGFDITPARLITGLVTEKGVCRADEDSIKKLFGNKFD